MPRSTMQIIASQRLAPLCYPPASLRGAPQRNVSQGYAAPGNALLYAASRLNAELCNAPQRDVFPFFAYPAARLLNAPPRTVAHHTATQRDALSIYYRGSAAPRSTAPLTAPHRYAPPSKEFLNV